MPPVARRGAPRRRTAPAGNAKENPQAIDEVDVEISPEDLATSQQPINVLVYGPSGHGKTTLLGSAPRAVFISTETGGTLSAKAAGSTARVIHAHTWERVRGAKKWCDSNLQPGDWVILDSLTKMQVLMIRWILRTIKAENASRDLDIPAIQDHQKWQNYFKRFVDELIDAPYNVAFICGDMIKEDQEGEEIVLPHIEGKDYAICNYVRAQTSLNIYYAVTDKYDPDDLPEDYSGQVRRALFQPVPPFVAAKDRFGLGMYRDVLDGEYPFGDWVAEIEEILAREAAEKDAEQGMATATPIRKARSTRATGK